MFQVRVVAAVVDHNDFVRECSCIRRSNVQMLNRRGNAARFLVAHGITTDNKRQRGANGLGGGERLFIGAVKE